jgi:hypothetical protein
LERNRIKDQIGTLEEQLELLGSISLRNESYLCGGPGFTFGEDLLADEALDSLRRLRELVNEQGQQKSVPAHEFLKRVTSVLVREASSAGVDLAIAVHGSGRVSLDMVEVSMGAILTCMRASLKGLAGVKGSHRVGLGLFPTASIYLEVVGGADELRFRIMDDGPGYSGSFGAEFEAEKHFQKLRLHISRFGGWFRRRSLAVYGGVIEFRVPMPASRFECLLLESAGNELLVPASCIAEICQRARPEKTGHGLVAEIDSMTGLKRRKKKQEKETVSVKIAVADFEFWISCESAVRRAWARRYPADDLVEPEGWLRSFGIFREGAGSKVLPLFEGEALMNFYLGNRRDDEGH